MKIETTQWGSRMADKPYFPMYLANGVDAMMINLLGSGDAWFEQCTDYGAPLSAQKSPGWYKCDRRTKTGIDLVYGILFPLFEFASSPFLNGDLAVPRNCRQYFDPIKATLTTFYEQIDNETEEWMRVKVTTFLTKQHVLVEHYEFIETPKSGAAIVFFLNSPSEAYIRLYQRTVKMDRASLKVDPKKSLMSYEYAFEEFRGGARSWCDCGCAKGLATEKQKDVFVYGRLQTRMMRTGESFTRYLAAIDNEDASNHRRALDSTMARCRCLGYKRIRDQHHKEWQDYFTTSQIKIPDAVVSFIYDVSRYLVRANQHPSGFTPVGALPYLWQGVMFWDTCFAIEAWLGCGNGKEAGKVLSHLETYMAEARKMARRYPARGLSRVSRGARLEWTVETKKFTRYPELVTQIHSNACWGHQIWSCFDHTRDMRFLKKHFHILEEYMVFLADYALEDRGDHFIIRRCQGVDESISNEKVNDTWSCAAILRGLMDYREATRILKRKPIIAGLDAIIEKLRIGLDRNVDARGMMQSFRGGRLPHWGSLIFDLFPKHSALKPTLHKMMENYDPEMKLYNMHGVTRYAEKSFPWANYWAARSFSRVGDSTAYDLLKNTVESVNYFGGMPERVWYHGELFNHWFQTAHGSMVWAVNGMLANATGNTLRILGGAQRAWHTAAFEGIHAGCGLVVSAEIRDRRPVRIQIVNLSSEKREIECVLGDDILRWKTTLHPGKNSCNAPEFG
ncbi:MAG: hypothetical protein HY360_12475 [Verrucomicrobia bacterium]|nr:hypothetical protein [Verrucomicrobiota bacterium]